MKAQVTVEMAVLLGILLVVLAIFFSVSADTSTTYSNEYSQNQISQALSDIALAGEFVYIQGQGAKKTLSIKIPAIVYNASINNRTIEYNVYPVTDTTLYATIYEIVSYNISGTLPESAGTYVVTVESLGGYVNVSYS